MVYTETDIGFALRTLARNPAFTAIVVATLALGIGSNTAIFSVVDGVLLKPLPFRDPDALLMVSQQRVSQPQMTISELDLDDYRSRSHVFEELGGFVPPGSRSAILSGFGNPVEIAPSYITQNYFSLLGIAPMIGRDFLPEEGQRGRNRVAILSYALWQSRFGGSRDILHQHITLDNQTLQVVGVMGRQAYPVEADVFVPFTWSRPERPLPRNVHEMNVVGRLRLGQTVDAAQKEMEGISTDLAHAYPMTNAGVGTDVVPLREAIIGDVREPILLLLVAVGLVLLIACGNVANLLLVRAASRQKEIAIRVALGAGRNRIIGQFATECLILSATGAVLGSLMAFCAMPVLRNLGAGRIPRLQHIGIDVRVLLFTTGITLLAAFLFGLIPALRYSGANLNQTLRVGGRTSRSDSGRLGNVLVAGEVALALVVVVVASLLVRSLNRLLDVHPGFRADHVLVAHVTLPPNRYRQADVENFYRRILPKVAAIPGVVGVSTATSLPLLPPIIETRFAVQGAPLPEPGKYPIMAMVSVDAGFFKTMGIPILRGRTFKREEVDDFTHEKCIINRTLANAFFGGEDPIGHVILTAVWLTPPSPCEIVGIAGDTRLSGLDMPPEPTLYFAAYVTTDNLVMRTTTDPSAAARAIQRAVAAANPEQPLSDIRTMDEVLSRSLSRRSFAIALLVIFSVIGLVLAAVGLYGVVSYSVTQRTQEIGVRMALGAQPGDVFALILVRGLSITGIGLVAGMAAAAGATRLMSSLLFGIGPADPFSYGTGCLLLLAVSGVACFIPAHRAALVAPLVALRYE
jgi:predicted permease